MKAIFFAVSLLFIFSCEKEKTHQNKSDEANKSIVRNDQQQNSTTSSIDQIKKDYAFLQTQLESKKISSSKFTYDCNEEPSGEVVFYSDQGEIKVIEHFFAEHSHFSGSEKYFIKDGKLFFIFRQETVWNFDGGTPEKPITKDDITETRIYIHNDKPLKCIEKKYSIQSNQKEKTVPDNIPGKEVQCGINELLKTYQSLLKHKDQKGAIQCL